MVNEKPEDITKVGSDSPLKPMQSEGGQGGVKPSKSFETYMKGEGSTTEPSIGSKQPTPLELAQEGKTLKAEPTLQTLQEQMNSTTTVLGDLQNQFHTKGLTLTQTQKYLLRHKLTKANESIRKSAEKMGVDAGPPPALSRGKSPITKFIGLLTNSQDQVKKSQKMIQQLGGQGTPLSPAELIRIQISLSSAQQQLEFASVLLSKAVESIKSLMTVQI